MKQQDIDKLVQEKLHLRTKRANIKTRNKRTSNFLNPKSSITIGMVAKYAQLQDSYLSVTESLHHAGAHFKTKIHIHRVQAEHFTKPEVIEKIIADIDGILIP